MHSRTIKVKVHDQRKSKIEQSQNINNFNMNLTRLTKHAKQKGCDWQFVSNATLKLSSNSTIYKLTLRGEITRTHFSKVHVDKLVNLNHTTNHTPIGLSNNMRSPNSNIVGWWTTSTLWCRNVNFEVTHVMLCMS